MTNSPSVWIVLAALAGSAFPLHGQGLESAADLCAAATAESSLLPFGVSATTAGLADNYNLPDDVTPPTCTASTGCLSLSPEGGRGFIFDSTGKGPDLGYRIVTDADCTLEIAMDPTEVDAGETEADDLALIVYQAACSNLKSDCVCVSDAGLFGEAEGVRLDAEAGVVYFVVIDGSTPFGIDPEPPDLPEQGPFDLSITVSSGSCQLCPGGSGACPLFADGFDIDGACPWSESTPDLCP